MTSILMNGVGPINVNTEERTLMPASLICTQRLIRLIYFQPQRALKHLRYVETCACDYTEDENDWYWIIPAEQVLCDCCVC